MRLSILYKTDNVHAEFKPDDFRKLLIQEFNRSKNIEQAFDGVVALLKKIALRK